MLTKEENELLTQVGPGTAMGELLRRYWIPALPSSRLAEPNGDPVRVRLVGENFVAWRDRSGRIGMFDENCMHRGASLALGRCEGDGLRCLYHGWKYAVDGTILETPNYKKPTVREKLKAPVYPVREAGGIVWTYLGPRGKEPPFPHYRFMDAAAGQLPIYYATYDCNFVQMMEGTIDPSHVHILHQDTMGKTLVKKVDPSDAKALANSQYTGGVEAESFMSDDNAPATEVEDTTFGCEGVFIFDAVADGRPVKYGRVYSWVMPFLRISPNFVMSVPIDDQRSAMYAVPDPSGVWDQAARDRWVQRQGGPADQYVDGHYRWTEHERWGQDRTKMHESFTGIKGVLQEDIAMTISMGPIYDRTRENLVPADQLIIRMRRRLLQAARDLRQGIEPTMLSADGALVLGGEARLLPDPSRWREVIVPQHEGFRLAGGSLRRSD
jgi:phthalate 4,5-dioxygenase